jgi:hypothetical protein
MGVSARPVSFRSNPLFQSSLPSSPLCEISSLEFWNEKTSALTHKKCAVMDGDRVGSGDPVCSSDLALHTFQIFACPSGLKKYSLAEVWIQDEFMPGGLVETV